MDLQLAPEYNAHIIIQRAEATYSDFSEQRRDSGPCLKLRRISMPLSLDGQYATHLM